MYAIIVTGGKQYKVEVGSEIMVEKLDNEVGDKVSFDILMIADGSDIEIGKPVLSGFRKGRGAGAWQGQEGNRFQV